MLTTTLIEAVGLCYAASTVHSTFHALSHSISQQFYEIRVPGVLPNLEVRIPGGGDA